MTTVSNTTIKIQTLTAALAFLVGCGTTEQSPVLVARTAVYVPVSDLMDISWSKPAPQAQTNGQTWTLAQPAFVSVPFQPSDRDKWPKPVERITLFTPPSRARIERQGDGTEDNLSWLTMGSCLLGLLASQLIRRPYSFLHSVGNVLLACIATVLFGLCIVMTAHILPTIAFYLVARNVIIMAARATDGIYDFITGAIQYIGFIWVPSFTPSWMTKTQPVLTPTPIPPTTVPAAWTGDRPLDESWDDEDDQPDNTVVMIALLRINALRQDFNAKLKELDKLEASILRSQAGT